MAGKLNYCNGLLIGTSSALVERLQLVQNMAAHLVTCIGRRDHMKPVLRDLHWLPVQSRIEYKILLFVFKAKHGLAPGYTRAPKLFLLF